MDIPVNIPVKHERTSVSWFDELGILCVVGKKGEPQTLEEAKKSTTEFKKEHAGKTFCLLLDITNSTPSPKEVRDYSSKELESLTKAMALISRSAVGRMVANLFFGLKPPSYPAKMFADETEAKAWLKQYL
jgi:hypothetical protein